MKKIESLKQLENLFVSLNAEIESGNGFKSYTLDSKNFKITHND